jgi:hypothetical protein
MIIHDCIQGTPEWHEIRRRCFTASELGPFALDPIQFSLTIAQIEVKLDDLGISRKGIKKKDDLIQLLPFPVAYMKLCQGARTAIIKKIVANKPQDAWQVDLADKQERAFEFNIPVQRGKALEPEARAYYSQKTGFEVEEVGFIEHKSGGFGCSPDGLIPKDAKFPPIGWNVSHGVEIKCPMPETHLEWLLDGGLPDDHYWQVHACMAVTGLHRWDFLSYCPGDAPLLLTVLRDENTDKLESGLKTLVSEMAKMKAQLADLWSAEFERGNP